MSPSSGSVFRGNIIRRQSNNETYLKKQIELESVPWVSDRIGTHITYYIYIRYILCVYKMKSIYLTFIGNDYILF